MSDAGLALPPAFGLPLHEGAAARVHGLAGDYREALVWQAQLVAHRAGAVQVSAVHVDRAYHLVNRAPTTALQEAAKLGSGALFGAGATMVSVGLQSAPISVWLTVLGMAACVVGGMMIGWVGGTHVPR